MPDGFCSLDNGTIFQGVNMESSTMKEQLVSAIELQEVELDYVNERATPDETKECNTYSIDEAIETIGFGRFHILLFIIMGSTNTVEAVEIMMLAVLSPEIRCEWHLQDWQVALVSMMVFFGFMVCGVLCGYAADRYGRWKVVFGGILWGAYFSLLTSFSPSYGWFIFLRSMVGCGVAAASQGYILKAEFIPAKHRAYLLPLASGASFSWQASVLQGHPTVSIFWMLGSMLIVILGMTVVPVLGWRWMIRLSVIPSLILIVLFQFVPESARFNVSAGNVSGAVATLQHIAKMNGSPLPEGDLVEPVLDDRGSFSALVSSNFRRTSVVLWYSWIVASFSYYGSVLSSSELLEKNLLCVVDADPEHSVKYIQEGAPCYCIPFGTADYQTLLISCLGEVGFIPLNIAMLNVVGRKFSLVILQLIAGLFFMLVNICSTMFGFTVLLFLLRSVVSMNFSVVYLYTAEVYPTAVRSIGLGVCTSFSRIGAMIAPFIAQVLMSRSVLLAMLPFSLSCFLCAGGALLLPIETRNRALLQNS